MRAVWVLLMAALLAACSFPALAQTPPPSPKEYGVISTARLSFAPGAQYEWNAGEGQVAVTQEFAGSVNAAYVLTTHLTLSGHAVYGFDSKSWRVEPAAHYRIPDGVTKTGSVAFEVGYQYFAGQHIPTFEHEWTAGAIWAMPLTSRILLGASEVYGWDNRIWRTSVGLQLPLWAGKESI